MTITFRLQLQATLFVLLASCTRTVEIPENKVGIVYKDKEVQDVVLKTGSHTVDLFAGLSLYETGEQAIDFKFDILFKDASAADIDFSISYVPKVDDLPTICRNYGQPVYYNSIFNIVETEVRQQVRGLLLTFEKNQFSEEEFFVLIQHQLKTNSPTIDIIEIKSFSPGGLVIRN
jgi:hypothetical protein